MHRSLRPIVWVAATLTFMAVAVGRLPAQRDDRGERVMNASCLACHDVRRIQVQALDAEQWTKTVDTMVERGAKVSGEDRPPLHHVSRLGVQRLRRLPDVRPSRSGLSSELS